jgi:hypothetical protein
MALLFVVVIRLLLWSLPYSRVCGLLSFCRSTYLSTPSHTVSEVRLARIVTVVGSHVPGASCLTQALALQLLMNRYGFDAKLRIGVTRNAAGGFEAHAWIESQGDVIIGGPDVSRWQVFPEIGCGSR